jgi:hypothetical protein
MGFATMFGTTSASADDDIATVAVFTGTAHINCFGCGTSTGTATLSGVDPGIGVPDGELDDLAVESATATYTVQEDPGVSCVITGSADGTTKGELTEVTFHWLRVGATAVITTTGEITGAGVAAFVVTDGPGGLPKLGVPCGGPVDATVAGSVAGEATGGDIA